MPTSQKNLSSPQTYFVHLHTFPFKTRKYGKMMIAASIQTGHFKISK